MTETPLEEAKKYINPEKEVNTAEDALNGAKDILAESVSDNADFRTHIRELTMKHGQLLSAAKDPEAESVYEMYYEFSESLSKLAGHRILAISRGEKEKFLTVKIDAPVDRILSYLDRKLINKKYFILIHFQFLSSFPQLPLIIAKNCSILNTLIKKKSLPVLGSKKPPRSIFI